MPPNDNLNDDQKRVLRTMTAVIDGNYALAKHEITTTPDPAALAEVTFMLLLPVVQVIAALNQTTPQAWWEGFCLHIAWANG